MFFKLASLSIFLMTIFSFSLTLAEDVADDGRWKRDRYYQGFKVFTRNEEGTSLMGIKAEGHLDASVVDLMATLRDVKGSNDWTPNQISKITLEDISDIEAVTSSVTDMPWPLKDRILVLNNLLKIDKKRKLLYVLSNSVTHPKTPKYEDSIIAHVRYSNIGFRPLSKNKTYVEMTVFVDPNGSIPRFLVNFYQKKFPVKFLKQLERQALARKLPLRPGIKTLLVELLNIINMPVSTFFQSAESSGRSKKIATK